MAVSAAAKDLLTSRDVADRLSICVRTLHRMVARGQFPRPIRFSRKWVRWKRSDVDSYLQALAAKP
jgi:predicted DNA-binding transcriptional regulator AlpA